MLRSSSSSAGIFDDPAAHGGDGDADDTCTRRPEAGARCRDPLGATECLRLGACADSARRDLRTTHEPYQVGAVVGTGASGGHERHLPVRCAQIFSGLAEEGGAHGNGMDLPFAQAFALPSQVGDRIVQACAWALPLACAGCGGAWSQAAHGHAPVHGMVQRLEEGQDGAPHVVQDYGVPGHHGSHSPACVRLFQQNPATDGALCDGCVAGDVEARVQSEPCVLHDAGTAGQGAESGGARSGTQCALNCSQETGSDGVGGLVGIRVGERSMRVSAQRNWQRVGLRMRRSDGRGILRSMIAESGCSRSVVAESAERGCRRVDCARIRTELAVVKRRMLELETNFDRLVTQSVHAAVKCRDVAQATLLLKLEEQLATLQKRAWRMDHVRVKREEWQHLHTLHQSALAENSTLRSKVSALERKLVLAERKGGEASSACNKIRVALSAKRSGDALERSQACFASSAR